MDWIILYIMQHEQVKFSTKTTVADVSCRLILASTFELVMSSSLKHISDLWELPVECRETGIKLLSKIFNKILSDPSNKKYSNLNFKKIRNKFDKCRPCIYLLYCVGFKETQNGNRLEWEYSHDNLNALKSINMTIHSKPKQVLEKHKNVNKNDNKQYKKVQQKIKTNLSFKQQQRNAIKQKIIAQRKEQKLQQQRKANEIRQKQEEMKTMSADFMKQQITLQINNYKKSHTEFADKMESISQLINEGYSVNEIQDGLELSVSYNIIDDDNIKINKIQTKHNSMLQKMRDYFDNKEICVCGEKLTKMNAWQNAYGADCSGISCDFCGNECKQNEIFYHCSKGYNEAHEGGYDVCRFCVENKENDMDSMYLFNDKNKNSKKDGVACHILLCENLVRIRDILQKYDSYITKSRKRITDHITDDDEKHADIRDIYNKDYDDVQLLEDFHHLLYEHSDKYEEIYQCFIETIYKNRKCELDKCYVMRRNHRHRN
eukprot:490628_1